MNLQRRFYERSYRRGTPPWDTRITPPEVVQIVEGRDALGQGRALDLGCGTGTNLLYLAEHGWRAVGVDFSQIAIRTARKRTAAVPGIEVVRGDVTRLAELGVGGAFDLVLDIGCFHSVPRRRRAAYADGVRRVTPPGATYLVFAFARWRGLRRLGIEDRRSEMERRFGNGFDLVEVIPGREPAGAAWYRFVRRSAERGRR
ncbi:MAG TPA: class I SAM-dependent methyltransferase [Actinomycetota bacterium]|jgi:SAM-dependent methyltransferase|nr:class I SAM-dependent methyltransferase [Actinomycetota bacterium]